MADRPNLNPNLVLPVGTRVVTRVEVKTDAARAQRPVDAVAEVIEIPLDALHSYRVRFADLPPADLHWSLYGVPEQIEDHERQECYWELQKILDLARIRLAGVRSGQSAGAP